MNKLPRMEMDVKQYAFRFYVTHQDRYDSSFQMFVEGEDATIHTLNGKRFFQVIREFYREMFPPGVKYVHFTMMPDTLMVLMAKTEDILKFTDEGNSVSRGRQFIKVRIQLKD